MVKMVMLVKRQEDMSHEEFVDYWLNEHVELGKQLPGIQRYETNVARNPEKTEYDGVAILQFEDSEAMKASFETDIGQQNNEDAANFIDLDEMVTVVTDELVQYQA